MNSRPWVWRGCPKYKTYVQKQPSKHVQLHGKLLSTLDAINLKFFPLLTHHGMGACLSLAPPMLMGAQLDLFLIRCWVNIEGGGDGGRGLRSNQELQNTIQVN